MMIEESWPQVRVTPGEFEGRAWRVDCDLCPDADPIRFYAHHWAVAAADDHARKCPNRPPAVPDR